MVEHLLSKCEALNSNPGTEKQVVPVLNMYRFFSCHYSINNIVQPLFT
jgi:hypothetical protein